MTALALVVGATDVAGAGWVHGLELVAVPVVLLAVLAMRALAGAGSARGSRSRSLRLALALVVGGFAGPGCGASRSAPPSGSSRFGERAPRAPTSASRRPSQASLAVACLATLGALLARPARCSATRPARTPWRSSTRWSGRARSCSAAATSCSRCSTRRSSSRGGSASRSSSPATGSPRRCPGRCSPSRPTSARSRSRRRTASRARRSALVAIYLPSFLLLGGVLPFWSSFRRPHRVQAALVGVTRRRRRACSPRRSGTRSSRGSIDGVGDVAFAAALLVLLRRAPGLGGRPAGRGGRRGRLLAAVVRRRARCRRAIPRASPAGIGWPR